MTVVEFRSHAVLQLERELRIARAREMRLRRRIDTLSDRLFDSQKKYEVDCTYLEYRARHAEIGERLARREGNRLRTLLKHAREQRDRWRVLAGVKPYQGRKSA